MAAKIQLPDGTPAMIVLGKWFSPNLKVIPVLEYFTGKVKGNISVIPDMEIARQVTAMLAGTILDPRDPLEGRATPEEYVALVTQDMKMKSETEES